MTEILYAIGWALAVLLGLGSVVIARVLWNAWWSNRDDLS